MDSAFSFGQPADDAECLVFFQIAAQSLLGEVAKASSWMEREGAECTRVARVGGKLAGGLAVQRMGQWFGGKSVPCGVIRAVAVAAEHRGSKVGDRLMKATLSELREAGVSLSMLFPATQLLYRRAGYEQAGGWVEQWVSASEFSSRGAGLSVERVSLTDPRLKPLYDERGRRSAGLFDRSPWLWRRTVEPMHAKLELSAYLIGPGDAPEGYLITHSERSDDDHIKGHLTLRDRALLTPAAIAQARAFLAHHRSVIGRVWLTGPLFEPLAIGLSNQEAHVTRSYAWMLRIVDAAAALAQRGYPDTVSATIHLAVLDDSLGPAEQRLTLRVEGGKAEVVAGGRGSLRIDVRGLAAMYTGFATHTAVRELGYLEGPADEAAALSALFAGPAPHVHEWV